MILSRIFKKIRTGDDATPGAGASSAIDIRLIFCAVASAMALDAFEGDTASPDGVKEVRFS
jgi:hypothetical protein